MSKKYNYSRYCKFSYECDKEINCRTEPFCDVFRSTSSFSTLDKTIEKGKAIVEQHNIAAKNIEDGVIFDMYEYS